jgi:autotransporter-associated beta strand protein
VAVGRDRGLGGLVVSGCSGFRGPGRPNGPPSRRLAPGGFSGHRARNTGSRAVAPSPLLVPLGMWSYPEIMARSRANRLVRGAAVLLVVLFGAAAVLPAAAQQPYPVVSWYDEFEGNSIDPGRWTFDLGTGAEVGLVGWGNNELQYYTDRPANARVADGLLSITARRENYGGMDYTSARLTSRGRFSQAGGRFEIRAALPAGQGFWPAFWMLPESSRYGGWAASGEIDILEARGQDTRRIENTIHYGGSWPDNTSTGSAYTLPGGGRTTDFHVYAVEWDLGPQPMLRWYVDDTLSWVTTQWWSSGGPYPAPFNEPFHLLVNLAVGGNFVGPPNGQTPFPSAMLVDYVRVYDRAPADITLDVPTGVETQFQAGYGRILVADSLTKTGDGTLVLDAANDYSGPTRVLGGELLLANPLAVAASGIEVATGARLAAAEGVVIEAPEVTLTGGRLAVPRVTVSAATGIGRLAIDSGSLDGPPEMVVTEGGILALPADRVTAHTLAVLTVNELTGGGLVDLGAGRLTIEPGGISSLGVIGDLLAGRNGGGWDGGVGITSTAAETAEPGTRAVGFVVEEDRSVVVAFAAPGDVDLDGRVDLFDLVTIDTSGSFGSGSFSTWQQGDVTYDGLTNVFDLIAIDAAGAFGTGNYLPPAQLATAVVPEPSAPFAGLLAAALLGQFRRFHRQKTTLMRGLLGQKKPRPCQFET